jgi:spore coat protein CotH
VEDPLFATPKVLQLKLEIAPALIEELRKNPKGYVKANVREGDKTYSTIGLRLKGASSVKLLDKKPSFTLKFNEFESGQGFYGHEKVQLNNSASDPSYLCEAIGGAIFRNAGVPAAKVTFARVELNGRDLGLYVLSQAPNRDFLSDHFKRTKGNFYEGNQADITEKLRLDSGNGAKEQADIKALVNAAREGDQGQRLNKLRNVLDLDSFISFLSVEMFTWHHRGYALDRDNYHIYHDPVADRLVFIPDALDGLFGKVNAPLQPDCKGMLARAVLDTGEGQRLYRERMTKLLGSAFKADVLQGRINDLAGKIRPAAARTPEEGKVFETAVAQLRDTIAQRARFIEEELKKPAK